jgi:hypothetical protein
MTYKADNDRNFSDKAIYRELNNLLRKHSIYIKINEQFSETNLILLGLFFIHDINKDIFYNIIRNSIYNNQGELISITIDDSLNIYKNTLINNMLKFKEDVLISDIIAYITSVYTFDDYFIESLVILLIMQKRLYLKYNKYYYHNCLCPCLYLCTNEIELQIDENNNKLMRLLLEIDTPKLFAIYGYAYQVSFIHMKLIIR